LLLQPKPAVTHGAKTGAAGGRASARFGAVLTHDDGAAVLALLEQRDGGGFPPTPCRFALQRQRLAPRL
jgi:hypothetical protein